MADLTKTFPRWVAVKGDLHGGVIHEGADGYWRANNWQGCLGGFATESEAELAILTAPPKPKQKRAPKPEPPESMRWRSLTDAASGFIVRDERGLAIGGVKPAGGRFAAWAHGDPLGEFDGAGQATSAIFAAHRVKKKAPMSMLDIARDYIAAGMSVLPVAYKTKKPIGDDWPSLRITASTAPLFFNGREMNIGVLMGEPSGGLSDVDLDSIEAIRAAPYLLPPTAAFGHSPSKPRSHYLYKSDLFATQTRAVIKLMSSDKRGILEIRVGGGGLGAQTIFPGSVHVSGEAIQWEESDALGKIAKVDGAELLKHCRRLAAAAELAMFYPQQGRRHGAAFVLGGFLARAGFSAPEAALFVEAVGAASDQSAEKVRDMKRTGRDGASAEKKAGFPQLAETFGEATAETVAKWLE